MTAEDPQNVYAVSISFGEHEEVRLEMFVIQTDYYVDDDLHCRLDEVVYEGTDIVRKNNWLRILSSKDPAIDKHIELYHNGWFLLGQWDTMEQPSADIVIYHCHNSLFPFTITINSEQY